VGTATTTVMSCIGNTSVIGTCVTTVKLSFFLNGLALFNFTVARAACTFYLRHINSPPFKHSSYINIEIIKLINYNVFKYLCQEMILRNYGIKGEASQ
jgi:hypothetical protein